MLRSLFVKDFAIIDRAEISLAEGMTVLTGETGAGKSLLVDALLLLAGGRGDANVVRHDCARAELAAEFDLANLPEPRAWLQERDLDDATTLRLRRVIRADGSSKAYVNDAPVSLALLRELSAQLVEIHGQHEHQALLTRKHQRRLLDAYGHHAALDEVTRCAAGLGQLDAEMAALQTGLQHDPDRLAFLRFQWEELQRFALSAQAYEVLSSDHHRLGHSTTLLEGVDALAETINGDDESALGSQIARIAHECQRLATMDPKLDGIAKMLVDAEILLGEAYTELCRYRDASELNPERYAELDAQLTRLHDLGRKYRTTPAALGAKCDQLAEELHQLEHADSRREQLQRERDKLLVDYRDAAQRLTAQRTKSAKKLSAEVSKLLGELAIAGQFEIQLETDPSRLRAEGLDEVEFMLSPNPGMPMRALRKIASGGELARVSLAIEVAAMDSDDVPVMIFDEVDAGIGGATAEVVGRKLRELGRTRQVLCVTHLAQVAAQAHQHYAVHKHADQATTQTEFHFVHGDARIEEVARMLGGVTLTRETRAAAKQMLAAPTASKN